MLTPLQLFIFAGLFSPGPNVILLVASGARFGLQKTLPHLFGVVIGVGIIGAVTGMGIGAILERFPLLETALRIIAAAWILWMAWALWKSSKVSNATVTEPMTFFEAVLFQWVNPKIWAVALAGTGYLIGLAPKTQAFQLGITMSITNLFVCFFWASFGHLLSGLMETGKPRQILLGVMAGLLALSAILVFV